MKKNLKAIVSIILVLGLLVCLTGCGENEKKQEAIDEFNTTAAAFNEVKDLVNANGSLRSACLRSPLKNLWPILHRSEILYISGKDRRFPEALFRSLF